MTTHPTLQKLPRLRVVARGKQVCGPFRAAWWGAELPRGPLLLPPLSARLASSGFAAQRQRGAWQRHARTGELTVSGCSYNLERHCARASCSARPPCPHVGHLAQARDQGRVVADWKWHLLGGWLGWAQLIVCV